MATQPEKKGTRIEAYVAAMDLDGEAYDPCYLAYFACFNSCEYYEAHDVLEHLWLKGRDENYAFFKGLIQFAGAFVHLKKQFERPWHPKDGRRMHPAIRLFALAEKNFSSYGDNYMGLDLSTVRDLAGKFVSLIRDSRFETNPWSPENAPRLELIPPSKG